MPCFDDGDGFRNLSPHLRYFEAICRAKGASQRKAEAWASVQVRRKGKRAPASAIARGRRARR